jgi:tryptophanyl-tRNA synthetase
MNACFLLQIGMHLTTHYDTPEVIEESVWDMVIDWLAAGVDPANATIFIQSRVPEHAELYTLLIHDDTFKLVRTCTHL